MANSEPRLKRLQQRLRRAACASPVLDLQRYIDAAGIRQATKDAPLFRTAVRKTGQLTTNTINGVDVGKMMKRRLRDASLPSRLSPHSFLSGG